VFYIAATHTVKEERRMINLNAQIIKKDGKKEYVVLPYDEFLKVQDELQDYEDLRCLREAKEAEQDAPTIGIEELKKKTGVQTPRSSRGNKRRG
jgi:hypothetical protein